MTRSLRTSVSCCPAPSPPRPPCAPTTAPGSPSRSSSTASRVPEYAGRGRIYIEALKGKEFTIRLSNPTSERVAVALSVDGRNVVDAKRTTELAATQVDPQPGPDRRHPGLAGLGPDVAQVLLHRDGAARTRSGSATPSNVGTIEAVFFREKRREAAAQFKDEAVRRTARGRAGRGRRGQGALGQCAREGPGRRRLRGHRHRRRDQLPRPVGRVRGRPETRGARSPSATSSGPQLVRLGVLPREDDRSSPGTAPADSSTRTHPTRTAGAEPGRIRLRIASAPRRAARFTLDGTGEDRRRASRLRPAEATRTLSEHSCAGTPRRSTAGWRARSERATRTT